MLKKQTILVSLFLFIVVIPLLLGMTLPMKMTDARMEKRAIQVEMMSNLEIHEGYVSQKEETILLKQGRKTIATLKLGEPVMVAQAEQKEKWGFFQFPKIGKSDDGTLLVTWQMRDDSHKVYGTKSSRQYDPVMSKDGGKTWQPQDKSYSRFVRWYNVKMSNGSYLSVNTPQSKDISKFKNFPKPVGKIGDRFFYYLNELPEELQGVYFSYREKGGKTKIIHAVLNDPGLLRYAINELMPVIWWGNIRELSDHSLVAGVYPCYYLDDRDNVLPSGVSFYRSIDKGKSWSLWGKIPFLSWDYFNSISGGDGGFVEPAFEVLPDSTFLCVMRTGSFSPMYQSFSYDKGKTWSVPEAFTPNGVKPQLLLLGNGVLVLASGRPGLQIRFSYNGTGKYWSEPIEMLPFMKKDGTFIPYVSCGYPSLIEGDDEKSFYIVYSDFTTKNEGGEIRKTIWSRKILVECRR